MRQYKTVTLKALYFLAVTFAAFVFAMPIVLAVLTSFKSKPELAESVIGIPSGLYLENYAGAIERSDFFHSILNTLIVVVPSVGLIVFCSSMSGYAVARYAKESRILLMLDRVYLASLMIPFQILMIPVYKIYKTLHLLNTLYGMVFMLVGTSIAYSAFLYVGFVKSVPREIEESAYIDGCSEFRCYWLITFPLLKPISATVAALHMMWLWNDFNISVILLQKEAVRTITIKQFYFFGQYTADYGMAFAAAILSMIPVVLCFVFMQRYIVNGIVVGAVKS